ncbi:prepilin peptidase [Thiohalorhabdus sp.]|uniref:prepilin peptidase n=1 Tax=Thiohalorhabdus sp. TaxID=3094134 RepID=UPI002FC3D963
MPETVILATAAAALGLIVGSFLNVVAHRLPRGQSLLYPPSACPHCGQRVRPWHNVPVASYLFLRGRCRNCGAPIGRHYPLTEAATGLISGITAGAIGLTPFLLPGLIFAWTLIALTRIDLDLQLLPDRLTLPLAGLGLALSVVGIWVPGLIGWQGPGLPPPLGSLLGLALGYGLLFATGWAYAAATGREGLGGGDLKLLGALGAWVGPVAVVLALFVAALLGSLIGGLIILLRGGGRHLAIPFGPFLAAGGWALLLWKDTLIRWYFGLSGLSG